jgi:hypothetical protein
MNTASGQAGGAWMLLLGGGLLLWKRGHPIAAGIVLGFLCAKPGIAAPVAVTLALTRQGRMFGGFVAGGALLVAGSAGIDGVGVWRDWVELLRGGVLGEMMVIPHRHHTLAAMLSYPVQKTGLEPLMKALGPLVGLALAVWAARRAGPIEVRDPDALFRFGVVLSMALLASPHLIGYDTGVHAPAFVGTALLLSAGAARRPRWGWVLLVLAFLAPVTFPLSWELHVSLAAGFVLLWSIWAVTELPHPLDRAVESGG